MFNYNDKRVRMTMTSKKVKTENDCFIIQNFFLANIGVFGVLLKTKIKIFGKFMFGQDLVQFFYTLAKDILVLDDKNIGYVTFFGKYRCV